MPNSDLMTTSEITIHLDEVLERRGMTLTALSDLVGVTMANLSILKTGKAKAIRFTTLVAICDALDCTPGELIKISPPRNDDGVGRAAGVGARQVPR